MKQILFATILVSTSSLFAQDDPFTNQAAKPETKEQTAKAAGVDLLAKIEIFSLPLTKAAELMRTNLSSEKFYLTLAKSTGSEGTTLDNLISLRIPGNTETASSESITEFIYPTEYAKVIESEKSANNTPEKIVAPSAFETRNLGETFEVSAVLNRETNIANVGFSMEFCRLKELQSWGKESLKIELPTIDTQRTIMRNLEVPLNSATLISTINPNPQTMKDTKQTEKRVTFVFITMTKIDVK